MLPNFLVIGAQKSGTTWLHRFCAESGMFVPTVKEVEFFNIRRRFGELGVEGYAKYFQDWDGNGPAGDVTPGYFWTSGSHERWGPPPRFSQGTPQRVKEILGPAIKLVLLLRNPVDRALSAHLHHVVMKRCSETQTIGDTGASFGIVHIGFYHAHLTDWLNTFDRKNFWIRTYEDFFSDKAHMESLRAFLGGGPGGRNLFRRKIHEGTGFKRGAKGAISRAGNVIASPMEIQKLRAIYAEDVALLARLGIDTSAWRHDFDDTYVPPRGAENAKRSWMVRLLSRSYQ